MRPEGAFLRLTPLAQTARPSKRRFGCLVNLPRQQKVCFHTGSAASCPSYWRRATNITVFSGNSIEEEHSKNAGEEQNPDDNHRRAGHTRHNGACRSVLLKGNEQR
jgi:hypothetical protein